MEMFGQDFENFEAHEEDADDEPAVETSNPTAPRVDKGKKGKLAAKSTGHTYQFQIMESIDVPRSEVKKFADPYHWLTYFPPIAVVSPNLFSSFFTLIICILRRTTVPWGHA
jgi:leucyl-tRNA synthetase